jgi:hypothetical protein
MCSDRSSKKYENSMKVVGSVQHNDLSARMFSRFRFLAVANACEIWYTDHTYIYLYIIPVWRRGRIPPP